MPVEQAGALKQAESMPGKKPQHPGIRATADGSAAVVWVESHICQGACAYPITPSTPMGDGFAAEVSNGKQNLWGETLQFLEPESEHSSASACEGFALAGGRVTNFTSGQGLILMKEVLYVISGKRLPIVFHIGARALTSHSLNVHCGHDDVMGVADIGWGILFGRNAQEAADLALIARRTAEQTETPFLNCQDGFLTTHTLETVQLPEPELMRDFIGAPQAHVRNLFDPKSPILTGCVQNQDSYMKGKVAQRHFYRQVEPALQQSFMEYARLTGRNYSSLLPYRMEDAEYAVIGMGSMMQTAEATVDYLRGQGIRAGCVTIVSFRPFPSHELARAVSPCKGISVIERCDVPLGQSNPLTTDVKAALADYVLGSPYSRAMAIPEVFSGVAGLGGRDVRPADFVATFENMTRSYGKPSFVLGVIHRDGIASATDPDVRPAGAYSLRGHSIGGFGSVTTNKVLATVASDLFDLHVQAFPKYGSEKKGLPTNYYLTVAPEPVRLHAELKQVEFVAVQDGSAFRTGDPLEGLCDGGVIYLQSALPANEVWAGLPNKVKAAIRQRHLRLFAVDAKRIARETSSRPDLQVRMQGIVLLGAFLKLSPFAAAANLTADELFAGLEKSLTKYFGKRGGKVVADNLCAARRGFDEIVEIPAGEIPLGSTNGNGLGVLQPNPSEELVPAEFCEQVVGCYQRGRDAALPADPAVARSFMPASTAALRSFRELAPEIPEFLPAACVGCMECVNACPDTAILAKVAEPEALETALTAIHANGDGQFLRSQLVSTSKYFELLAKRGEKGGLFGIFVDPEKCKGCGECIVACGRHEALRMVAKESVDLHHWDRAMELHRALPSTPHRFINEKTLGDMMLASESQLFAGGAGSCMGCGEATALRMMLAATGFVYGGENIGIVAATGCNTVYGSTYPFNPFSVPWTNSLFENAPADAMGIRLRWNQQGEQKRRLWVLGGDGAMYDIGFQSLSRMMTSGLDIKVLVLDTQVYSNTGGQTSTATFTSQDSKMSAIGKAQSGKLERRKELSQILLMHPGVFVAQTTPAHLAHFYKAVMAANEFPGPAAVICYATCQPEHGVADDRSLLQARLAVESRAFPLFVFDPRKGEKLREGLSLAGNPAMKEDWYVDPRTNQAVDFVSFARTEGRFARHFAADGTADQALLNAQEDRLLNWRRLQELAGLR
jgi:pyruvate-ferredoxin/flavodoxin oxidoreductase